MRESSASFDMDATVANDRTMSQTPLEVQIVTDEELEHRIEQEILQDVVEAEVIQPIEYSKQELNDDLGAKRKKLVRWRWYVAIAIIVVATVVAVVVGLVVRNSHSSGPTPLLSQPPILAPTLNPRMEAFRSLLLNNSVSGFEPLVPSPMRLAICPSFRHLLSPGIP
jgi:hypothetical protein